MCVVFSLMGFNLLSLGRCLWMMHITALTGSVDIIMSVIMYIEYTKLNNGESLILFV